MQEIRRIIIIKNKIQRGNNMLNRKILSGIMMIFAIVLLSACGNVTGSDRNQHLIIAQDGEPVTLDPHRTNDARSAVVINQMLERLIRQDEQGVFHPWLATEWEQIDELTYEFKLREDVYFHNGEPLRASDVVFSLRRAANSATSSPILGVLDYDSIYEVDEFTVRVGTQEPFVPLLAHLAHTSGNILSQVAVETLGDDFGTQPVGTGSFQIDQWFIGDRVELVRFENYYGETTSIDRLTFRNIPEAANRLIELETGQADIALDISPFDMRALENHADLNLVREDFLRSHYIGFNTSSAPFDDVRVRQAVHYAVDVDTILDTILEGVGVRSFGPLSHQVWASNPDLYVYDYNVDRARELLAEAGLESGFTTNILTDLNTMNRNIAEVLQRQLAAIGIQATITSVEWASFLETTNASDHEIFITGWTNVTRDPDYGLFPLFHSSMQGPGGNRAFYSNPEVDRLLEAARQTVDPAAREALYLEVQELIVADSPWVFLNTGELLIGTRNNVQGFVPNPTGHHRLSGVFLD